MDTRSDFSARICVAPPDSLIAAARGDVPADLLIRDVQVADLLLGRIYPADVAIKDGWICGIGPGYSGVRELDGQGSILAPGFMDAHTHLESTCLTPWAITRKALLHGTVAMVCDPHEIANVAGVSGIEWMLETTEALPLDFFFTAPSCVPATSIDSSNAVIGAEEISSLLRHPRVIGLGEVMNYPGVIHEDPGMMSKLKASAGYPIDGHAPMVTGKGLNAYLAAGVTTDHECTRRNEVREKVSRGMRAFIRQGSSARNLRDLASVVNDYNNRRFCLVTDDLSPKDLLDGHLDRLLRQAVRYGISPLSALCMVSLNVAEAYGMNRMGAIAVGWRADLVLLEDLERFKVLVTIKDGEIVAKFGRLRVDVPHMDIPDSLLDTVHLAPGWEDGMRVVAHPNRLIRVIRLVPGQIITEMSITEPRVVDGEVVPDPGRDILKLVVLERHRSTGRVGVGFVQGFELHHGAMASSVAHDSHNIIAVGASDTEITAAIRAVERSGGGMAVARGEQVNILSLPVAGLLSDMDADNVSEKIFELIRDMRELGCSLKDPFAQLSFLALPVIPSLRLTDRGLFNSDNFSFVDLWN